MNDNLINQQGQSSGRTYGGNLEPEKDATPAEKPLTIEDVNAAIIAVVQPFIEKLTESIKGGFATKNDLNSFVNRLSNNIQNVQSRVQLLSRETIIEIAKEAVPGCLRNLDSGGAPRTGNVLMLAPAPAGTAGNADSCYFGEVKAGGGGLDLSKVAFGFTVSGKVVTILTGTIDRITVAQANVTVANDGFVYVRRTIADDTMLVATAASVPADDATYKYYRLYQFSVTGTAPNEVAAMKFALRPFDIDGIKVPFGTAEAPHLVWNATTGIWERGLIDSDCLPEGGTLYQVLQRVAGGAAGWDWTRWAVEIT